MRTTFLILVLLHGLIHLLGFVKAFNFKEIPALTIPISKPMGAAWMAAALLFLVYGALYFTHFRYSWAVGLIAVVLSQVLVIYFWKDAKFGSLPNVAILLVALFAFGRTMFSNSIEKERAVILQASAKGEVGVFSEQEISHLPSPVKKWLLSSGAIGQKKALNGKITQIASMKMKPEQQDWYSAEALQYTVISEPAFIWSVDMGLNSMLWFQGRDKFLEGKGEMLIKLNSLINMVDEQGEKINEGSIQRFLGEMVWFPALAVSPYVRWEEVDELSARATMAYKGTTGSGTFYFNEKGDFVKFVALRFQGNTPDAIRKEWILTVDDYRIFEGIKIPSKMRATWKTGDTEWNWLKLEIINLEYNITEHPL